jgi:hypothetical protein
VLGGNEIDGREVAFLLRRVVVKGDDGGRAKEDGGLGDLPRAREGVDDGDGGTDSEGVAEELVDERLGLAAPVDRLAIGTDRPRGGIRRGEHEIATPDGGGEVHGKGPRRSRIVEGVGVNDELGGIEVRVAAARVLARLPPDHHRNGEIL